MCLGGGGGGGGMLPQENLKSSWSEINPNVFPVARTLKVLAPHSIPKC